MSSVIFRANLTVSGNAKTLLSSALRKRQLEAIISRDEAQLEEVQAKLHENKAELAELQQEDLEQSP